MDWANFDHRIPSQSPVSDKDRETVLRVAEEAIMKTDLDPEIVLDAAARALGQRHFRYEPSRLCKAGHFPRAKKNRSGSFQQRSAS